MWFSRDNSIHAEEERNQQKVQDCKMQRLMMRRRLGRFLRFESRRIFHSRVERGLSWQKGPMLTVFRVHVFC